MTLAGIRLHALRSGVDADDVAMTPELRPFSQRSGRGAGLAGAYGVAVIQGDQAFFQGIQGRLGAAAEIELG